MSGLRLGVNVDHIATLRQPRYATMPDSMELNPNDYNFRVPTAFIKAEGKYDLRPKL